MSTCGTKCHICYYKLYSSQYNGTGRVCDIMGTKGEQRIIKYFWDSDEKDYTKLFKK